MAKTTQTIIVAALLGVAAVPAAAGDLIYFPKNPSFGGNPDNFNSLIGLAQIQNQHVEGGGGGGGGVPNISFPPITIDLGGTGSGGTGTGSGTGSGSGGTGSGGGGSTP
ncbi:MAG: curli assembly protein CsgF [Pseudomonadota bacterium]